MRNLRAAAWAVFLLDLVILAQLLYSLIPPHRDPAAVAPARGLAVMLGSAVLGIAVLLAVSTWLRSQAGFWLALVFSAVPLALVLSTFFRGIAG